MASVGELLSEAEAALPGAQRTYDPKAILGAAGPGLEAFGKALQKINEGGADTETIRRATRVQQLALAAVNPLLGGLETLRRKSQGLGRVPKGWTHRKLGRAAACAAGSFRRIRSGKALVTVCCPKGKWSKKSKRCRVGMRGVGLDKPKRRRR